MTLDEGSRAELLQTGARRGQSLTRALSTCTGVLKERQKALPPWPALGCSELSSSVYKFIIQNLHCICCFHSPWRRNNQSTEIASLEGRVEWLQSDCAQQSPWQAPHTLHIYSRTCMCIDVTTAGYTKTFSCPLSDTDTHTDLLMKGLMLSPVIGAMLIGMGSGDVSQ